MTETDNRYDDEHAKESQVKAETGAYPEAGRSAEDAVAEHDPVRDPEPGAETQDARAAAKDRREPPDPSAPAASPDSGAPGAAPSPTADPAAEDADDAQGDAGSWGTQQTHKQF